MSSSIFGHRLAQLRRRRGLSQQQLADLLCETTGTTSLTRNEISRWERGQRRPAQAWLGWLSLVLHVPAEQLTPARPRPVRSPDPVARRWAVLRHQLTVRRPGVLSLPTVD